MVRVPSLVISLAVVACTCGTGRANDDSDIRATVKSYLESTMIKCDADTAKKQTVRSDDSDAIIDAMVAIASGRLKLNKAMVGRFGEGPAKTLKGAKSTEEMMALLSHDLDSTDVKIDTDEAIISRKSSAAGPYSLHLKKKNGGWKIDLSLIPNFDETKRQSPMLHAVGKVMADLAVEVDADKYKTIEEVNTAMKQRMSAAYQSQQVPHPGAEPGK